jgi:hypothetical protein
MADRPGLDDNDALNALIALWRQGSADLDSRLEAVHQVIRRELLSPTLDANRIRRLRLQVTRLEELGQVATQITSDLTQATSRFITEGRFQDIYAAGANVAAAATGLPFSFTAPHRAAIEVLAQDTFDDVLTATKFIERDAKDFVRKIGRNLTGFKLTSGVPVKAQARRLADDLRREFTRRGMAAVTYVDGSRHSFGEYSEMLLRTKTGVAYNMGTLNHGRAAGITHYELLDGSLCGLTSHHDPELANGLIVTGEVAASYPLAHPNCRRSVNPRPDITAANAPTAPSVQSQAAREDQARFEAELRRQQQARAGRRARRQRRQRRQRPPRGAEARRQAEETQLARVRARDERLTQIARAKEVSAAQRAKAVGPRGVRRELLDRYGVTEDQYLNAKALTNTIKADIRKVADQEATTLGTWLVDNDLAQLSRPKRLRRQRDIVTGRERFIREQSGYDFLEQLDDAELARVRGRYTDSDLFSPDVVAEQVRRKTNLDLSDDEAIDWLIDRWLHEDGLRSLASGRIPAYADPANLIPADYSMEGYKVERLFPGSSGGRRGLTARQRATRGIPDPTPDEVRLAKREARERHEAALEDAVGHVAQVQAEAAESFASRALGRPTAGPAPWEMDLGDFIRELEEVESILSTTQVVQGVDPGGAYHFARTRIRELAPVDIDPEGALNPFDLFESIRITAQAAGFPVR